VTHHYANSRRSTPEHTAVLSCTPFAGWASFSVGGRRSHLWGATPNNSRD